MKKILVMLLWVAHIVVVNASTYYVATTGDDNNSGSIDKPWATLTKAISKAKAGDIVYIRGGIYYPEISVDWIPSEGKGADGTPIAPIRFFNYPEESPVFDFINCPPVGNYNSGFFLNAADYIQLRGLTIKNVKQTRNYVECLGLYAYDCTNLRLENMTVCYVDGNAYRFLGAWRYPGTQPYMYPEHATYPGDSTFFINCDAHDCCDSLPRTSQGNPFLGGAADGYKTHNEAGAYLSFDGCRAWKCSDDGFDASGPNKVVFNNCWSFKNGYIDGDGVGFKTGALYDSDPVLRIFSHCLSALNSTYGFLLLEYPDYSRVNARYYNNTSYKNTWGFAFSSNADKPDVLGVWKNNISYNNTSLDFSNAYVPYNESNNSWKLVDGFPGYISNPNATATNADFISLDSDELSRPRQEDGSLPVVNFCRLVKGSDLIDKGTNVGLSYSGSAPDIGYDEYAIRVTGITVTGAGGATTIDTDNGTLQLTATIAPDDATNKTVTWSIHNETGQASINASGLVKALKDGNATAKATANDGSGVYGELTITISNQSFISVTGITVTGAGGVTTINTNKGTLQLTATVIPENAENKTVTWSIVNGTGKASINSTGLVTAISDGTVTAKASANDESGVFGQLEITISNQVVLVTGITVTGADGLTTIDTYKGTLQLNAEILPVNATNKAVTWSVINGTGQATIGSTGLLTAVADGNVTAKATATDGSAIYGTLQITIANQNILVDSIVVRTQDGSMPIISKKSGTLQMVAIVYPENATNKKVEWSVENRTGSATIDSTGLVTSQSDGTVRVAATAVDGSNIAGYCMISITHQSDPSGLDEQNNQDLKIYQSSDNLHIEFNSEFNGGYCILYSITGILMYRERIHSDPVNINISFFPKGFYIVKLLGDQRFATFKILMQ
jgi:uncharacterized protein YjdB